MKDTILAACIAISSQPIFSRRITSGSEEFAVLGNIGAPNASKPKILSTPCHDHTVAHRNIAHTSIPTLDVRPVSSSCLCRNKPTRALPLPSSREPHSRNQCRLVNLTCDSKYLVSKHLELWIFHCPRCQPRRNEPPEWERRLEAVNVIAMSFEGDPVWLQIGPTSSNMSIRRGGNKERDEKPYLAAYFLYSFGNLLTDTFDVIDGTRDTRPTRTFIG